MKFGLFTCGYQRGDLEQAFVDAAAFGYDYIELWGGRPHAYAPDLVRANPPHRVDPSGRVSHHDGFNPLGRISPSHSVNFSDRVSRLDGFNPLGRVSPYGGIDLPDSNHPDRMINPHDRVNRLDQIRHLSDKYRLPVLIYTPEHNAYPFNYMMGDQAQWEDSIEYLKTAIKASSLLGAEALLLSIGHSGGLSPEAREARLLKSLRILSEEARKLGQTLLLENLTPMESDGYTDLESYRSLFTEDLPCLKAMCDVVVPFVQGQDPADYGRLLGSRLGHLHVTDSNGLDESHVMPGDGVMDLKKVLKDFRNAGYDGNVTIELVTAYMADPSAAAALAIRRIKELL